MAIQKEIENQYGVNFNYHKIKEVRIYTENDGQQPQVVMLVESYRDKQARIDGKTPVRTKHIIYGADFALEPFYALLKNKFETFSDGQDDLDNSFKPKKSTDKIKFITQSEDGRYSQITEGEK